MENPTDRPDLPLINLTARWHRSDGPPPAARRPGSRSPEPDPPPLLTATSRRTCPRCGSAQGTHPVPIPPTLRAAARGADVRYFWATCPCEDAQITAIERRRAEREAAKRQADLDGLLAGITLDQVDDMTLAVFDPTRLSASNPDFHPYNSATRWLAAISDKPSATYRDHAGPACALYFYCAGKGRGKTHLAAAIAHELRRSHALVAFLYEESYLSRLWSVPFEQREAVIAVPGQQTRLTVIDDLGRLTPGKGNGIANAWDGLINRRWLARGWTIITSNYTLDELADRGTLSEASYSRLRQMTRNEYVYFDGEDQRLVDA